MADKKCKQLDDTQKSLASALARVEIQRVRLKKLELENVSLRNSLRSHGINPGQEHPGSETVSSQAEPRNVPEEDGSLQMPAEEVAGDANATESHDVILYTSTARIPGRVIIHEDSLEFVAVAAKIHSSSFVGVRFLGDSIDGQAAAEVARNSGGARSTWWDSLFGSCKGDTNAAESQHPLARASAPPLASSPGAWQSKPLPRSHQPETALAASPDSSTDSPRHASGVTISDSIAAGIQEGLSSLSQFTAYLRGDQQQQYSGSGRVSSGHGVQLQRSADEPHSSMGGTWQIIWRDVRDGDTLQTLTFETSVATRSIVQTVVERWNDHPHQPAQPSARESVDIGDAHVREPEHLPATGDFTPRCAGSSTILTPDEVAALATALPGRRKLSQWQMLYSSEADGFSLQTVYRAGAQASRSLLIVEDFDGFVFGAYCTEQLRVSARYQGNGECFVFQMRPHRLKYDWHSLPRGTPRNDFFMMLSHNSIGIGGAPHFALWLDSDLLYGNSGICHTFSNPCLAGAEDFKVKAVELWGIG